jgi:hypothetical protein
VGAYPLIFHLGCRKDGPHDRLGPAGDGGFEAPVQAGLGFATNIWR